MKIKNYVATLQEKMSEFDMWVTPSLGEIRDTPQFKTNLEQLKTGFFQVFPFARHRRLQEMQFNISGNIVKAKRSCFLTISVMCFF